MTVRSSQWQVDKQPFKTNSPSLLSSQMREVRDRTKILKSALHQISLTQSTRLLNKLNVPPQDTQTSVRVMCVGPRTNFGVSYILLFMKLV